MSKSFFKNNKQRITRWLEKKPHLKDNDHRLIATMWWEDIGLMYNHNFDNVSGLDVLKMVAEGKLTSPETIRRMRQKLQEENEHLRGDNYIARKNKSSQVKTELGYI